MNAEREARVRRILALALGREIEAGEALGRSSEPKWDSLKHVEILFALEEEFGVRFDEAEMAALDSIEAILAALERHDAP